MAAGGSEKKAWKRFKRKFDLEDTFVFQPGHLRYSWDNKKLFRHDPVVQSSLNLGDRVIKSLDQIYHFVSPHKCAFTITSTILPGLCL